MCSQIDLSMFECPAAMLLRFFQGKETAEEWGLLQPSLEIDVSSSLTPPSAQWVADNGLHG